MTGRMHFLYITSDRKKAIAVTSDQYFRRVSSFLLNNSNVPASVKAAMGGTIPQYSATMATVIVVIGPIMVILSILPEVFCKGTYSWFCKGLTKSISKGHFPQIFIMWMKTNKKPK